MTIESTFYDTSASTPESLITEVKWSKSHPHIGSSEYGVDGVGDFKVTAHPSTPLAVNVSSGKAWGHGIMDESSDIETVVCDAPAAGTTRWDLICLRRNWTPLAGGPTSVTKVAGGTVMEIPSARENTPGTLDDQPLYLAQWTAGQTQPTALIDLRCWAGNGGMFAVHDLVRTYLKRIGSNVKIGGRYWSLEVLANDIVGWVNEDGSGPWVNLVLEGGWVNNGASKARARMIGRGGFVHVSADVTYPPGAIHEGWIIAKLPGDLKPIEHTFIPGTTDSYRKGTFYSVNPAGITVGPFPVGKICQLNGIAALR